MKKPSLKETMQANKKALHGLIRMAGKEVPEELQQPVVEPKKPRKAPVKSAYPTEHEEQVRFIKYWRHLYPQHRVFAIPNAAVRSPQLANYLRAEGMTKGIPDLFIPSLKLWIEFKRVKGGEISPEQDDWEDYLVSCGYFHIFAFGFDDAITKLREIYSA